MLRMSAAIRATSAQRPSHAKRPVGPAIAKKGGMALILLSILFCSIFYQNLPPNFGLNDPNPVQQLVGAPEVAAPITEDTGNAVNRIIKMSMILAGVIVVATRWLLARAIIRTVNVGFLAFMVLIPLSALWSIERSATLNRFVSLFAIVLVCFAISLAGWSRKRFQQVVIPPVMYVLVVSLIVGMVYPTRIIEFGDDISLKGSWHGITLTKNQFGMTASIGLIICVNGWLAKEGRALWSVIGAAISLTCLILSRSNTSLLAGLTAISFMVLVMRVPAIKQRYSAHVVIALVVIILLYECVILDVFPGAYTLLSPIRAMTGKDGSLSGRTIIWDLVKQNVQTAPYLGSGYGAYWGVGPIPRSPSYIFTWRMFFYPTESHNGYLEIVNDLGYLGLACFLALVVSYIRQGLELMRFDRSQAALYLALLFQQMVMNLSESEWFARDIIFSIIILGIMCMTRALYEGRLQRNVAASTFK